jgi:hypothetical protein
VSSNKEEQKKKKKKKKKEKSLEIIRNFKVLKQIPALGS